MIKSKRKAKIRGKESFFRMQGITVNKISKNFTRVLILKTNYSHEYLRNTTHNYSTKIKIRDFTLY